MNKIELKNKIEGFSDRLPRFVDVDSGFKSAVCICLVPGQGNNMSEPEIVFEVRAADLCLQPSDICLPGGGIERGEEPLEAALRELNEELFYDLSESELKNMQKSIRVIGPCDIYWRNGLMVFPFLIELDSYTGGFDRKEVQEVFSVPLRYFIENEPERYRMEIRIVENDSFPYDRIVGGKNYEWIKRYEDMLFYQYEGRNIWGLTAKIIHSFVQSLKR